MKYQDLKVRDAGRLAALGLLIAVFLGLCIAGRGAVEPVVGHRYYGVLAGLGIGCVLCWVGSLWYLFTSPAQNAKAVERAIQKKAKNAPTKLDLTLFDPNDPDYRVVTAAYLLRRFRRSA
jgi:hypothetical protein